MRRIQEASMIKNFWIPLAPSPDSWRTAARETGAWMAKWIIGALTAITLLAMLGQAAHAATYYCAPAPAGSWSTGDGSSGNPWGALGGTTVSDLEAKLTGGDIVICRDGYHGYITWSNFNPESHISFRAEHDSLATLSYIYLNSGNTNLGFVGFLVHPWASGSYVGWDSMVEIEATTTNITFDKILAYHKATAFATTQAWADSAGYAGIFSAGDSINVLNSTFKNNKNGGLFFASGRTYIRGCTFDGWWDDGIKLTSNQYFGYSLVTNQYHVDDDVHNDLLQIYSGGTHENITIENNILRITDYDRTSGFSEAQGIFTDEVTTNLIIRNNVVLTNWIAGIFLQNVNGVQIINNTVLPSDPVVGNVLIAVGDKGNTANNVYIYNNISQGVDVSELAGRTYAATNNLTVTDGNLATYFRDYDTFDLYPAEGISQIINAGVVNDSIPTIDIRGYERDIAPDIGAYEYGAEEEPAEPDSGTLIDDWSDEIIPGGENTPADTVITAVDYGNAGQTGANWAAARNGTGNTGSTSIIAATATDLYRRAYLGFVLPEMATVTACTLQVYGSAVDTTGGSFSVYPVSAFYYGQYNDYYFPRFYGRQTAGAHTSVRLGGETGWHASNYLATWINNFSIFTAAGRDTVLAHAGADTLKLMLLSSIDYANTEATGTSSITFINSAGSRPRLAISYTTGEGGEADTLLSWAVTEQLPDSVTFDDVLGTKADAYGDVDAENEWFYSSDTLYVLYSDAQTKEIRWFYTEPLLVTSIVILPTTATLQVGAQRQYTATVYDQNNDVMAGYADSVVWDSSDDDTLTVSAAGLVTGIGAGVAEITATIGDVADTLEITITELPIVIGSITITPATRYMEVGDEVAFTVSVKDTAGDNVPDSTAIAVRVLSDSTIAEIDEADTLTATDVGTLQIRVTFRAFADTAFVTIGHKPTSVTVAVSVDSLKIGKTTTLLAALLDENGDPLDSTVVVSVNDEDIAELDGLDITAIATGEAIFTGTFGVLTAADTMTVYAPTPTSVIITPRTAELDSGDTRQYTGSVLDEDAELIDGYGELLTWVSRDTTAFTVSATGLVRGITPGSSAVLVASYESIADSVEISIPVPVTNTQHDPVAVGVVALTVAALLGTGYTAYRRYKGSYRP